MIIKTATVVGFGRFGEFWAKLLSETFQVSIVENDPKKILLAQDLGFLVEKPEQALQRDAVFYCVPISLFREIFLEHTKYLKEKKPKVLFDCLSVKVHPKNVFLESAVQDIEIGLLHPLFGPDSVKVHGLKGLPLSIDRFRLSDASFKFWNTFFKSLGIIVHEMSAEEHDTLAANSQGLTHYIGRILGEMKIAPTAIDTVGAAKLHEIKEQVCNDSEELFYNLQQYNPYTLDMRIALGAAQSKIYTKLLPNRINSEKLHIGIQGGPGSFNEEATLFYLEKLNEKNFKLEYLYTSDAVLKSLYSGKTDRGVFAIHNSLGGIVDESVQAMAKYNFSIIDEFSIIISHCLLLHPQSSLEKIDTIMGHPQALKQCAGNLKTRFPNLKCISGNGELADPSKASEELCRGSIPKTTAILGSKTLSRIFGLQIAAENLQDLAENYTSFLWVER